VTQAALNSSALGNSTELRPEDQPRTFRLLWPSLRTLFGDESSAPPPSSLLISSSTEIILPGAFTPLAGNLWHLRLSAGAGGSSWVFDADLGQVLPVGSDTLTVDLVCDALPDPAWTLPALQRVTAGVRAGTRASPRPTRSLPLVAPAAGPVILSGKVPTFGRDVYLQGDRADAAAIAAFYAAGATLRFFSDSAAIVGTYTGLELAAALTLGTPQPVPAKAVTWNLSTAAAGGPSVVWLEFGLSL